MELEAALEKLAIFSIAHRIGKFIAGPIQVYPHHDNSSESFIREVRNNHRTTIIEPRPPSANEKSCRLSLPLLDFFLQKEKWYQ